MIKRWLKQLRCKHEFYKCDEFLVDYGRAKMFLYRCDKCNKVKVKLL